MESVKQVNIKNQTYYFYNDVSHKRFESKLLKYRHKIIQKHWYLQDWIYYN